MADETKTQIPKPTRQRGPMGRMGGMRRGEKAKDFKGTMRQLLGYIGQHKIAVFTAVAFAVCSVIFNIVGPKVLGQVTTKLFEGLVAKVNGTGDVDFAWIAKTLGFLLCLLPDLFFHLFYGCFAFLKWPLYLLEIIQRIRQPRIHLVLHDRYTINIHIGFGKTCRLVIDFRYKYFHLLHVELAHCRWGVHEDILFSLGLVVQLYGLYFDFVVCVGCPIISVDYVKRLYTLVSRYKKRR